MHNGEVCFYQFSKIHMPHAVQFPNNFMSYMFISIFGINVVNMHCSQLAKAGRGKLWLQMYKRETK